MAFRYLPNSLPTVSRALQAARDEWQRTPLPADRALSAEQWTQLDPAVPGNLLHRLLAGEAAVATALAAQVPLTEQTSRTGRQLAQLVSHFHQVLGLAIARGRLAASARRYYHRDETATTIPDLSDYPAIEEAALAIVAGEAERQTAEGAAFVPMAMPAAAEVAAALAQFRPERQRSDAAQAQTARAREQLRGQYPAALALAVDVWDTVEFFYRHDRVAASRRAKCARWGVVYLTAAKPAPPAAAPRP